MKKLLLAMTGVLLLSGPANAMTWDEFWEPFDNDRTHYAGGPRYHRGHRHCHRHYGRGYSHCHYHYHDGHSGYGHSHGHRYGQDGPRHYYEGHGEVIIR